MTSNTTTKYYISNLKWSRWSNSIAVSNFGVPLTSWICSRFYERLMIKMFFNRSKLSTLFSTSVKREDNRFADIYGCDNIKKLFRMVLGSNHTCSVLLTGPPASAKTLFLQSLMKLKDSYFIDCSSASKSGIVDYIFENKPRYLLLDELENYQERIEHFF